MRRIHLARYMLACVPVDFELHHAPRGMTPRETVTRQVLEMVDTYATNAQIPVVHMIMAGYAGEC